MRPIGTLNSDRAGGRRHQPQSNRAAAGVGAAGREAAGAGSCAGSGAGGGTVRNLPGEGGRAAGPGCAVGDLEPELPAVAGPASRRAG